MKLRISLFVLLFPAFALADVSVVGGVTKPGKFPASEAKTLIATLVRLGPITCTNVRIRKADSMERITVVDVWRVASTFEDDPPLQNGDLVMVPEHVIGCVDSSKLHEFLQRYLIEKKRTSVPPLDWSSIAEPARSAHSPRNEKKANKAPEPTP